jgi:hypothetical protein
VANPETADINIINKLATNYIIILLGLDQSVSTIPAVQDHETPRRSMYTSLDLARVPMLRCSKYCATKSALYNFILSLRRQLQGSEIEVVEIFALAVQLELHGSA